MHPIKALLARAGVAVACLAATVALAANTFSQRSPFTQGHWWNAARAGSGFDIFNAADQVMVIWYTYDEAGRPIWYTAQGNVATLNKGMAWPLLQHAWTNGHKADPVTVGSITLAVRNPDGMDVQWTVNGHTGTWPVTPFVASGTQIEIDHSGSWFDPANPGWGMTVTQQGDVLGGVLYAYDAQGAPTWLSGFDRGRTDSAVQLYSATGSCPWCTYSASQLKSAGQLGFEFHSEIDATLHPQLSLALPAGLVIDGARIAPLSRPVSARAADRQLVAFDDAASLKAFLDQAMLNLPPGQGSNGVDFSAAPPAPQYSTTNLQEQGVDEADVVKTDGNRIFTFAYSSNGTRLPALRMASIRQAPFSVAYLGQFPLAGALTSTQGLYLDGSRLEAVYGSVPLANCWCNATDWRFGTTYVDLFDVSGAYPVAGWHARIDGHLVSSRRVGDRLYLVTRYVPTISGVFPGATSATSIASNRQALSAATLDQMLPHAWINGATAPSPLVSPASVLVPPLGERGPVADFVIVTTIDLANPRIADSVAIVGGVEAMYASSTRLVLATSRFPLRSATGTALPEPPAVVTDVHELAIDSSRMAVVGSATVEGYLGSNADQAAFRMSETGGVLRIVTSSGALWNFTQNRLAVLAPSATVPGLLKTVSVLPNAAHPESLGKPNEFLYATRFVDDRLYAVTFPQANTTLTIPSGAPNPPPADPLFVVDLSNAADPRIVGELEVPGFSEYLHPLPNGLMLGFGRFVDPTGANKGLQLSLYDVRDAGKPVEKQRVILGDTGSDSALLRDHHAMAALVNADGTGSIAFPVRIVNGAWQFSGMARFDLRGSSAADMQLVGMPALAALTPAAAFTGPDPAIGNGRPLLSGANAVFVGNGLMWWQDAAGASFGPQ